MLNFTWWVNRKDAQGRNIFQGGFLGLDNIGVFDRSAPLPTGGFINQADGTAWMAMYSLNLMRIALELARHNKVYEDIATKFFEHFLHIVEAMNNVGGEGIGLWDEKDEFYYDVLNLPDGRMVPLKVRSLVGLIPLFAVEVLESSLLDEAATVQGTPRMVPQLSSRPGESRLALERTRHEAAPFALAVARPSHEMPAPPDARRDGVPLRLRRARHLAASSGTSLRVSRQRQHDERGLPARRIELRSFRRQLELAWADLDARELPAHRVAAKIPPLLRRRFQSRVPHRLWPVQNHRRSCRRTFSPPLSRLS